jgi:hypothetical protein
MGRLPFAGVLNHKVLPIVIIRRPLGGATAPLIGRPELAGSRDGPERSTKVRYTRITTIAIAAIVLAAALSQTAIAAGGNSGAAKACQQDGYLGLRGSNGETFKNAGDCASYAARGGHFASGIIVPAGKSLTFHGMMVNLCNAVSYGYQPSGGANVIVGAKPSCADGSPGAIFPADVTVGPFLAATQVRLFLTDANCGDTYYSDGDHALLTPVSPTAFHVDIMDSGGVCEFKGIARAPSQPGWGNLSVELDFTP